MKKKIVVNDKMQKNYVYYLTEKPGRNFNPEFKPELTPKQMLSLGVLEGKYMRDCGKEFPRDWFARAKFARGEKKDPSINFFRIWASQPLAVWRDKGWIREQDPRGWFQWYCRYWMGRRSEDDSRQIKRWKAFQRHRAQLVKNCRRGDFGCRPKQRQALLHWAYDSRKV